MKPIQMTALFALAVLAPSAVADDYADSTRTKVGEDAPDFVCRTVSGEEFSLGKQRGKVVLINFFATWCGPFRQELPHLEKQVLNQYKDREDFKLIVIGREHVTNELAKFGMEQKLTVPMAPDPKRAIYGKYAEKYIPRNFVIGKDGIIKKVYDKVKPEGHAEEVLQVL